MIKIHIMSIHSIVSALAIIYSIITPKIALSQSYKKINIEDLYEKSENKFSNGQIFWEKYEKIEIKGIIEIPTRNAFSSGVTYIMNQDQEPRGPSNNGRHNVVLDLGKLSRDDITKIVKSSYQCRDLKNKIQNYSIIRGSIIGNYPYEVKLTNSIGYDYIQDVRIPKIFHVEIDNFELCLTKEEYSRR